MMEIKDSIINKAAYLYIALPVMCFLLFYMDSWAGRFLFIVMSVLFFKVLRKEEHEGRKVQIAARYIVVLGITAVIWTYLGGQGNLYYQSSDWHFRNAIYRDLLYYDWPVIYPEFQKAMVFYIGHWLPPALLTKGIGMLLPSLGDSGLLFQIGNILLWIWTAAGIFLVENLLVMYARPSGKKVLIIPVVLVFFSGLDIVGVFRDFIKYGATFEELHIEWWSQGLQFSSLTTCLFWVFHQTVIPWIVTLCVLQEKSVGHYVFMGLCALSAGPMPFVGVVVYMLVYATYRGMLMVSQGRGKAFGKEFCSLENLLALIIIPVFLVYYGSNNAVITGIENTQGFSVSVFTFPYITWDILKEVFFFLLLEAGVYLVILYKIYRNDIFYYITAGSVLVAPFIRVGNGTDFVMRFSIPAVMTMTAMVIKFLTEYDGQGEKKRNRICCAALLVCLGIGSVTACTELFRGYNALLQNGRIINVADDIKTMNRDDIDEELDGNIMSYDYENNIFFRYLAPIK